MSDNQILLDLKEQATSAMQSAKSAHNRLDGLTILITDFTKEMRVSNNNISELVGEVKVLATEISHLAATTKKHDDDIEEIKDNMETKDTVLQIYTRIEKSDIENKKSMDAIMKSLRDQEDRLEEHENEPAKQALENQKALKRWFVAGFGSILLTIASTGVLLILFNK